MLAKGVVLEGEAGMLLFQGIHLVEERLVLVVQVSHSLATLEGINFTVIFYLTAEKLCKPFTLVSITFEPIQVLDHQESICKRDATSEESIRTVLDFVFRIDSS